MEENKFFKTLWRINGLAIFIVLFAASCLMLNELYDKLKRSPYKSEMIKSVAEDPKGKEKWALGHPINIYGSNFTILPLVSENKEIDAKKMKRVNIENQFQNESKLLNAYNNRNKLIKNVLFINSSNNQSHWLFDGIDRLIFHIEPFQAMPLYLHNNGEPKTKLLFFQVVVKDTNGDQLLNYEDSPSLAVSNADGNHYKVIIEEYDRIISKAVFNKNKILIVYQNSGVGYSLLLNFKTLEVISKNELAKVKMQSM